MNGGTAGGVGMVGWTEIDDIKADLATAVGLVALGDVTLHEATQETSITRWEIEEALEQAALATALRRTRRGRGHRTR